MPILKKTLWVCVFFFCAGMCPRVFSSEKYVAVLDATPVLNTPDMRSVFGGADGRSLAVDEDGALRALEFVALPGTVFAVYEEVVVQGERMYRAESPEYPYETGSGYFIPAEFCREIPGESPARTLRLPSVEDILGQLRSWVGLPYVWGGNAPEGVAGLLDYFDIRPGDSRDVLDRWMLKGLDCSGLLYAASEGWTPRNTEDLVSYGWPVEIESLTPEQMSDVVQPLDLIVWKGHVVIVLNDREVIESRMDHEPESPGRQGGVRTRGFRERMEEILRERSPVNNYEACARGQECFVIRRWHETGFE